MGALRASFLFISTLDFCILVLIVLLHIKKKKYMDVNNGCNDCESSLDLVWMQ